MGYRAAPLLACLLALPGMLAGQVPARPQGFVSDFAGVIKPQDRQALEEQAAGIRRATSAEVAVVTVKSLGGRDIEGYANELFKTWGIGKKGKDNGVLILVAVDDRKMRIETGYGVESVLPDGLCGDIIRKVMAPKFRGGDFGGGLADALAAVGKVLGGEPGKSVLPPAADAPPLGFILLWEGFILFFTILAYGLAGVIIQACVVVGVLLFARSMAGTGFLPLFLVLVMMGPFFMIFLLGFIYPLLSATGMIDKKRSSFWTGLPMSSGGGSGWGGGGFGGGGFGGFGGGSSGGGGASGGW